VLDSRMWRLWIGATEDTRYLGTGSLPVTASSIFAYYKIINEVVFELPSMVLADTVEANADLSMVVSMKVSKLGGLYHAIRAILGNCNHHARS
jgi:hypothetical protein